MKGVWVNLATAGTIIIFAAGITSCSSSAEKATTTNVPPSNAQAGNLSVTGAPAPVGTAGGTETATATTTDSEATAQPKADIAETDPGKLLSIMLEAESASNVPLISAARSKIEQLGTPRQGDTVEADRLNKIGLSALKGKNYTEAARQFELASRADPSDAKYLSNMGYAELNSGELQLAEEHTLLSLRIAPSRPVAWGNLGLIFAKKGDDVNAIASLMLGYRISAGETLGYLLSLKNDDNAAVQQAANAALSKIQSAANVKNDQGTPDQPPAQTANVRKTVSDKPLENEAGSGSGIGYKKFFLGMTLNEFEKVSSAAGCDLIKTQHADQNAVYCQFSGSSQTIANVPWLPVFYFVQDNGIYSLIGIEGDCSAADVETIGGALKFKYGETNGGHNCWYFSPDTHRPMESVGISDPCDNNTPCLFVSVLKAIKWSHPNPDSTTSEKEDLDKITADFSKVLQGNGAEKGHVEFFKYPAMCEFKKAQMNAANTSYKNTKDQYKQLERQSHSKDAGDL